MRRRSSYRRNAIDVITDAEKAEYDKQSALRTKVNIVTTVGSLFGLAVGFLVQKSTCGATAAPSVLGHFGDETAVPAGPATPPGPAPAPVPAPTPAPTATPAPLAPSWACTMPVLPILGLLVGGYVAYKLA